LFDRINDSVDVVENLFRSEAENLVALAFQPRRPLDVAERHFGEDFVDAALHFDHQPLRMTGEVGDVLPDRRLPSNVRVELAEFLPEPLLRIVHSRAKPPRASHRARRMTGFNPHHAFTPCWATQASAQSLQRSRMRPM